MQGSTCKYLSRAFLYIIIIYIEIIVSIINLLF